MRGANLFVWKTMDDSLDRRFDSDFRTLQHLVHEKEALGEVLEAELHYDHPNAGWIHGWTEKEYTPGQGMLFALGESLWQILLACLACCCPVQSYREIRCFYFIFYFFIFW